MESIKFKPKRIMASKLGNLAQWGDKTPEERFWSHIKKGGDSECWEWQLRRNHRGYGAAHFKGKSMLAHRLAWQLMIGAIPDGMFLCHHCDNPPCCNPAHLFVGDHAANAADCKRKGRTAHLTGEKSYLHKLTWKEVEQIRKMGRTIPTHQTAGKYGVTVSTINKVIRCDTWRHFV